MVHLFCFIPLSNNFFFSQVVDMDFLTIGTGPKEKGILNIQTEITETEGTATGIQR